MLPSCLVGAYQKIAPVKECCDQIFQNAILEPATVISLKGSDLLSMGGSHVLPELSTNVSDCKSNVLR